MKKSFILAGLAALALAAAGRGWWVQGHATVAEAAVTGLPDEVPAFFRAAGKALGHYAGDPDRWKNPACKPLRDAISPDHYIDLEDFHDKDLPVDPYPFYDWEYKQHVDTLRQWLEANTPNVYPVGRNGMHRYNNQDHSMYTAMLTVENILGADHDIWSVNVDAEYHEESHAADGQRDAD